MSRTPFSSLWRLSLSLSFLLLFRLFFLRLSLFLSFSLPSHFIISFCYHILSIFFHLSLFFSHSHFACFICPFLSSLHPTFYFLSPSSFLILISPPSSALPPPPSPIFILPFSFSLLGSPRDHTDLLAPCLSPPHHLLADTSEHSLSPGEDIV